MRALNVHMLGGFSIESGEVRLSDSDNRSRKVWMLMAYLIYNRHRVASQQELIDLLWGKDDQGANPVGALKTMFHRVRSTLDKLWPSAGHDLILCHSGGYCWNRKIPVTVDADEFRRLAEASPAGDTDRAFSALQMYQGDFLETMSSEPWVIPIAAYCHNLYMEQVLTLCPELMDRKEYASVTRLCRAASAVEPYNEEIHCFLMEALLAVGDQKEAANIYRQLSERLSSDFGILPGEKTRELYHRAVKITNDHAVSVEEIQQQLRESTYTDGALICEYDFFRVLYRSMARSMARSGIAAHIALLSVEGENGQELSRKKLDTAMENLEEQIRLSLRRGDSAAKCSISQYVLMLPRANYENSCAICERIRRAFYRRHPHSEAVILSGVSPLQPEETGCPGR